MVAIEEENRWVTGETLCAYRHWRPQRSACSVASCERAARKLGLCLMHYWRARRARERAVAKPPAPTPFRLPAPIAPRRNRRSAVAERAERLRKQLQFEPLSIRAACQRLVCSRFALRATLKQMPDVRITSCNGRHVLQLAMHARSVS